MEIKTLLDYEVILANQAQPVCFAIRFDAPEVAQPRPQPAAFCIVLDRSGSMEGKPLERAKAAAALAVRNLRAGDHFAMVVFDSEAQALVPLQSAARKEEILRRIDAISVGGSTNLAGGWSLGRDELKKAPPGCSRRLLLLSDGQLNCGITEPEAVKRLAGAGLEAAAVRTSCLGFGSEYNEDLMSAMAQATGGQFYDADSPERFGAIFESELQGLQRLAVQNLRVRLNRLEFCESIQPLGNCPSVRLPDGRMEYAVGDLVSGETRVLCFQLDVLPLPWVGGKPVATLEGERLIEIEALWDELGESQLASNHFLQVIRIQATQNPAEIRLRQEVVPWVAMQKAGVAFDAATRHMDEGNAQAAEILIEQTVAMLKRYGAEKQVAEAVQQLDNLLFMIRGGEFSVNERKRSTYRSHSYRKMSSSEQWSLGAAAPSFKKPSPDTPGDQKGNA
jgi:Ca-activated chloride channel family protein